MSCVNEKRGLESSEVGSESAKRRKVNATFTKDDKKRLRELHEKIHYYTKKPMTKDEVDEFRRLVRARAIVGANKVHQEPIEQMATDAACKKWRY